MEIIKNNTLLGATTLEAYMYQIIPPTQGRKLLRDYDIPSEVIIYKILPYLQYEYQKRDDINIKTLFGYFKSDYNREIWLIWRGLNATIAEKLISFPLLISLRIYSSNIEELIEYPLLNSLQLIDCDPSYGETIYDLIEYPLLTYLEIYNCENIYDLVEYPLLTSLTIDNRNIIELKEYTLLTSLTIGDCNIRELKEYTLLTSLKIDSCDNIRELKEYPLLTSLIIKNCGNIRELKEYTMEGSRSKPTYKLLTYLEIYNCDHLKNITTNKKRKIQKYMKKYKKICDDKFYRSNCDSIIKDCNGFYVLHYDDNNK